MGHHKLDEFHSIKWNFAAVTDQLGGLLLCVVSIYELVVATGTGRAALVNLVLNPERNWRVRETRKVDTLMRLDENTIGDYLLLLVGNLTFTRCFLFGVGHWAV